MEPKDPKQIITKFFNSRFSEDAAMRFRFWFRMDHGRQAKEVTMEDIWNEAPSEVTERTVGQLERLHARISAERTPWQRIPGWARYVSVAAASVVLAVVLMLPLRMQRAEGFPTLSELYVPCGEPRQLVLADGTQAWVNAGSILIYPEEFKGPERRLYLSGQARFEVAHNPDKPFVVDTEHIEVTALGTVFSVDAYPVSDVTAAILEEGSIRVDGTGVDGGTVLQPSQQLTYDHASGRTTVKTIDAETVSAWKDGYLIFENAAFADIVVTLERRFGVNINYDAAKFKDSRYYIKFPPHESLENALSAMEYIIDGFGYRINGKSVSIY